jgi:hypothetical protein
MQPSAPQQVAVDVTAPRADGDTPTRVKKRTKTKKKTKKHTKDSTSSVSRGIKWIKGLVTRDRAKSKANTGELVVWALAVLAHLWLWVFSFLESGYGPWKTGIDAPSTYVIIFSVYGGLCFLFILYIMATHPKEAAGATDDAALQSVKAGTARVMFARRFTALYFFALTIANLVGAVDMGMYMDLFGNHSPSTLVSTSSLDMLDATQQWRSAHRSVCGLLATSVIILFAAYQEYIRAPGKYVEVTKEDVTHVSDPDGEGEYRPDSGDEDDAEDD